MNHVVKRTITALSVAAAVILAFLYVPKAYLLPMLAAFIVMVHIEFSKMVARKHEIMEMHGVGAGICLLASILSCYYCGGSAKVIAWLPFIMLPFLFFALALCALFGKSEKPLEALGTTTLGFLYIPFLLSFLLFIPIAAGMKMLLYYVAITKISDMGGFAFGMAFGKHKMCPTISPKKSWEGMGGSIFGSCLISCCLMPMTHFGWVQSLVLGVVAATVGTLGDLVESRFKREVGVKDSSQFKWTNGMGGFLDMFDSLIFAPAILFLITALFFSR